MRPKLNGRLLQDFPAQGRRENRPCFSPSCWSKMYIFSFITLCPAKWARTRFPASQVEETQETATKLKKTKKMSYLGIRKTQTLTYSSWIQRLFIHLFIWIVGISSCTLNISAQRSSASIDAFNIHLVACAEKLVIRFNFLLRTLSYISWFCRISCWKRVLR